MSDLNLDRAGGLPGLPSDSLIRLSMFMCLRAISALASGPAANVRIPGFKNLPRFRHDPGLQNYV
jgi:hypothetical protein